MQDDTHGQTQALSCSNCRKRKVKCNKIYPCEPCTRQGLPCQFPSRRKARQPRQPRNDELLGRLARLEAILGEAGSSALRTAKTKPRASEPRNAGVAAEPRFAVELDISHDPEPVMEEAVDPQPEAHTPSIPSGKYMSSDFWSNLCDEVEGIKQTLEQPSESDEDEGATESTPDSVGRTSSHFSSARSPASAAYLGNSAVTAFKALEHPAPDHMRFLCATYFSNVHLMIKAVHRPTISRLLHAYADLPNAVTLDGATEAIFFAIYFAAVTTLTADVCLAQLGEPRAVLVARYRSAAEIALARADYINSSQLEPLQAFTIYLAVLRAHKESKASWALMSLAMRLAQGLELHKDGDGTKFGPYVAETRRRLWWALVTLDIRAVEDRGSDATIAPGSYDTRLPSNLNDEDYGPETTVLPPERSGPTDATFNICTAVCSGFHLYMVDPKSQTREQLAEQSSVIRVPQSPEDIVKFVQELEARFINSVDYTIMSSVLAAAITRLIILKVWLMIQYPFHQVRLGLAKPPISRENLLRIAISILEQEDTAKNTPGSERWLWWVETYPQWHPLAVALSELCTQTEGEIVDRAWKLIDEHFPHWSETIADTKSGTLWRPIRKLWKKAKAARMEAMMNKLNVASVPPLEDPTQFQPSIKALSQPGLGPAEALTTTQPGANANTSWFSAADFLGQDPAFWMSGESAQPFVDGGQDAMDWTTWNEFVNDTYAGEGTNSSDE